MTIGLELHNWAKDLWPICRSITGNGVRQTFDYLKKIIPINIIEVPCGTQVFDWVIPDEWNIREAWIKDAQGNKIIDFAKNNLHVISYSEAIDKRISLAELKNHIYTLPDQPNAVPYITSYYKRRWGFCMTHDQLKSLTEQDYHVCIDSNFNSAGSLTYADLIIPGKVVQEVLISTYICHPSMANDELSGPVVAAAVARELLRTKNYYTYRFVFIPETIGSVVYLSKHLEQMKKNTVAGFVLSCIGDNKNYSILSSPYANTLTDKVAEHVAKNISNNNFKKFSFLERGSDERQYCAPGVDLPVVGLCRTKYMDEDFPEYHTSLDDLENVVTPEGLAGGYKFTMDCVNLLEKNFKYKLSVLCEPQLGKRGLYPAISTKSSINVVYNMMNFVAYCNGKNDLVDICEIIGIYYRDALEYIEDFEKNKLIHTE